MLKKINIKLPNKNDMENWINQHPKIYPSASYYTSKLG